MADTTSTASHNFPSEFASQTEKSSVQYLAQYASTFHATCNQAPTDAGLMRNNRNYTRYRQYGRGEQSKEQYKELLGLKKEAGKLNTSFRNLNFDTLKVVPKMRGVLINKIVNNNYNLLVKAIDPYGMNARRDAKAKYTEFLSNQEHIQNIERLTKSTLESPVGPGEIPPARLEEIDPHLDQTPKDATILEVKDYLTWMFGYNEWPQLAEEAVGDLVDLGVFGMRPYVDAKGMVRIKRIIPERCIVNKCVYPDFRDLIRFGEYSEITVSDLRVETKGKFGSQKYQDIANKYTKDGANRYTDYSSGNGHYNANSYSYAYDHERLTKLEFMFYSTDTDVYTEVVTEAGNTRMKPRAHDYVPFKGDLSVNNGKGATDEEYFKLTGKKIYRQETKNIYKGTWIVGSDIVYNGGLMENMPRTITNPYDTKLPVVLISLDFMSPIGNVEPLIDEIMINWLQFQSHIAASKPPGIAIEKKALARVSKGAKKWDPKEDIMMYAELGSLLYDGYDQHGNALTHLPFKELQNGLSSGAAEHWGLMMSLIDLTRSTLGLNPMTEGQAPPERLGKYVAQLSFTATDNAMAHMIGAYRKLYERTAQMAYYMLQSVASLNEETTTEALGMESYRYLQLNKDIGLRDMGIMITEGPDVQIRERISQHLQKAVDTGEIDAEDAIAIEKEDNTDRAIIMMKKKKREGQQRKQQEQMQIVQEQAKAQGEQAQILAKQQAELAIKALDKEKELLVIKSQLEMNAIQAQHAMQKDLAETNFVLQMGLEKIKIGGKIDIDHEAFLDDLIRIKVQGKTDKQNKPAPAAR